jgi:hypothetical protein
VYKRGAKFKQQLFLTRTLSSYMAFTVDSYNNCIAGIQAQRRVSVHKAAKQTA